MQKLNAAFLRGNQGSALVFALVFGFAASIAGIGALKLMTGGSDLQARDAEIIKSYWAGEGAIRVALRYLSIVVPLPNADIEPFNPPGLVCNGAAPSVAIRCINAASRVYTCSTSVTAAKSGMRNKIVCSKITIHNMSRFTLFENKTAEFWEKRVVHGDYHTNGFLSILKTMTDEAHVTGHASASSKATANTPDRPDFPDPYKNGIQVYNNCDPTNIYSGPPSGGWQNWLRTRFPDYSLCGRIPMTSVEPASITSGVTTVPTNGGVSMVAFNLKGDSVEIWKLKPGGWHKSEAPVICGQIFKCDKPAYVGGAINGKLTIVTTNGNDITIGNNITYANTSLAGSDDVLGLVSGKNIVIPGDVNNPQIGMDHAFKTGGGTIYGSLFMPFGGLDIADSAGSYEDYYTGLYDLNIYGGATVDLTPGTLDYYPGVGYRGLSCKYRQDPRFLDNSIVAPGIPFTKVRDAERSTVTTEKYMSALCNGTWRNIITDN